MTTEVIDKTLTVVDRATRSLTTANNNLVKANTDLTNANTELTGTLVDLTTEIEFKQSEFKSLDDKLAVKVREHKAELALKIKENEQAELAKLLSKDKLAFITIDELDALKAELESERDDKDQKIALARKEEADRANRVISQNQAKLEADHRVKIAETNAKLITAEAKVTMLEEQLESAQQTVRDEREARIKIAESQSKASGVIVNTSK